MTPDDYRYGTELTLKPGVTVAVIAPTIESLMEVVRFIGGPKTKLDMEAVQEVAIARRPAPAPEVPVRRFVSRAIRPHSGS